MSFSKAKLKRFNDIDVTCGSPAASNVAAQVPSVHSERKEQIEKFFKDAIRFAANSKDTKESAASCVKGKVAKEDKKSKGLRLFRTPSLPHRLRFRQNSDVSTTSGNNATSSNAAASTPNHATTPGKELKLGSRIKKEALQLEIRMKNELIENYLCKIDTLTKNIDELKQTECKLREDKSNISIKNDELVKELAENALQIEANKYLTAENQKLTENYTKIESELQLLTLQHNEEKTNLSASVAQLKQCNEKLTEDVKLQDEENKKLMAQLNSLEEEIVALREKLNNSEQNEYTNLEMIENLKNTIETFKADIAKLNNQIEIDALSYAQETKISQNQMECLKNERNTLKNDLASKCDLIRLLQDELLDKNCEIDAHCDTIRQLCREKSQLIEKERLFELSEQKLNSAEMQAEQKFQKLESDMENAIEREKVYWRGELEKRQKLAENEIIKIELEKQDVMVLLETTNEMLRERDEQIQKYKEQLRNGIDYYVQLTDNLQKQVVDLKQEMAKIITEKYNYQLTLGNTRSTVNILMERLKKSDADVEQLKAEQESLQLSKGALEQSYLALQTEMETLRIKLNETEETIKKLNESSQTLQKEVHIKETLFNEILTSEENTLEKFNKIASSFQQRIDGDATQYLSMYRELKNRDEAREVYMQDMKKALDEFATVLQFAQIELDNKERALVKLREECDQLKLENISLKSKVEESNIKKENSTDLEKIEDLLIDSELRAECDKITSWLLNSSEKCVQNESSNEINELLKPATPNNKLRNCTTPVISSTGKQHTPKTPRTPRTPRTTPKKVILFAGKENVPSPQKQVLKARNV